MKNILSLILSLCFIPVQAQLSFVEKYNLPVYDCNNTSYNKFWEGDVIIVTPDNAGEVFDKAKELLESNKGKSINVAIKSESQLGKDDFNSNMFILGTIQSYIHWDKFGIPVSKPGEGFGIGNYTFTDSLHSFIYISDSTSTPARIAFIGNNMESYKQIINNPPVGFKYHVKKDAIPIYTGNDADLFDLSALKKTHYKVKESKYYIFMLSEDLAEEQMTKTDELIERYDRHVEDFVEKLKLDMPQEKIKTYIHADQPEIKYMTGNYRDLCYDGTMYGYAPGNEIHSWAFSGNTIEHESGHNLINSQINKWTGNFISEGIQMWYLFNSNDEFMQQGILMAKQFASEDLSGVICGEDNFFQGDKYYLISGIFVGYLIEKYGIDKFKELYTFNYNEMPAGFEKTYSKSLLAIIEDYQAWLTNN